MKTHIKNDLNQNYWPKNENVFSMLDKVIFLAFAQQMNLRSVLKTFPTTTVTELIHSGVLTWNTFPTTTELTHSGVLTWNTFPMTTELTHSGVLTWNTFPMTTELTHSGVLTWNTFPMTTELTHSGLMFPDASAALVAISCRSVAEYFISLPPYVPNGVLLAATMNTSFTAGGKTKMII